MSKYFVLYVDPDEIAPDNIYLSNYEYHDENDFYNRSGVPEMIILKLIPSEE